MKHSFVFILSTTNNNIYGSDAHPMKHSFVFILLTTNNNIYHESES